MPKHLMGKTPSELSEDELALFEHLMMSPKNIEAVQSWQKRKEETERELGKKLQRQSFSEYLATLPAGKKYQQVKDALVTGIGVPETEAEKLLMKHMGLPPALADSLPDGKEERFTRIWEYACITIQKLKKTAYPEDKEQIQKQYTDGTIDDVTLYLKAIDWLNELFGDGGQPK